MPVASAEAAILTALLPSSSAPISRSRLLSRALTIAARRFPCFSSRAMLARDEAVSAVSLPAKNADNSRQAKTITREIQSSSVICSDSDRSRAKFFSEEGAQLRRIDIVFDEGLADAAHQ